MHYLEAIRIRLQFKLGIDPTKMQPEVSAKVGRIRRQHELTADPKLAEMLAEAEKREARRVKTKPSKAAKARRVDEKKGRSAVKAGRGRVKLD